MAPLGGKAVSRGRSRDCRCSELTASFESCHLHIWMCGLPGSVAGSPPGLGVAQHIADVQPALVVSQKVYSAPP